MESKPTGGKKLTREPYTIEDLIKNAGQKTNVPKDSNINQLQNKKISKEFTAEKSPEKKAALPIVASTTTSPEKESKNARKKRERKAQEKLQQMKKSHAYRKSESLSESEDDINVNANATAALPSLKK